MILYEYPCNERIRTFLRVEALFDRFDFFAVGQEPPLHHVAVNTLFDLLDMTERTDLRSMALQDLERQRMVLSALREHPEVSADMLDSMLTEMNTVMAELADQGRIAQALRDNEWLSSLRSRLAIPGGSSQVDLPSFHGWKHQPLAKRLADIKLWSASFLPLGNAIRLVLRILRGAGNVVDKEAKQGAFQEMLEGKSFQLLRVWVDPKYEVFPEMSANKYVILVRFAQMDGEHKALTIKQNIPFQLARCNIG